jgi:hypothetical protein
MVKKILFQEKNTKDKDKWFVFSTNLKPTKKTVDMIKKDFPKRKVKIVEFK